MHLLTREALALYRSKLRVDGLIAFNVSNRYMTLEPVLGNLARDAGLACVTQDEDRSAHDGRPETDASDWVVMARHRLDLRAAAQPRDGWHACPRRPGTPVWTDDFSNLLGVVDLDG